MKKFIIVTLVLFSKAVLASSFSDLNSINSQNIKTHTNAIETTKMIQEKNQTFTLRIQQCVAYSPMLNLSYSLTHIMDEQYLMKILIIDQNTKDTFAGVIEVTHKYGVFNFIGSGTLENGNKILVEARDDFGRFHDLYLTGFLNENSKLISFSCLD